MNGMKGCVLIDCGKNGRVAVVAMDKKTNQGKNLMPSRLGCRACKSTHKLSLSLSLTFACTQNVGGPDVALTICDGDVTESVLQWH
jgi:hypothetical protein